MTKKWYMNLRHRLPPLIIMFITSTMITAGCNSTDPIHHLITEEDTGISTEDDINEDVDPGDQDIEDPAEPDPNEPVEEELITTIAPSGGAQQLQTKNHRIRLIVAPRGGIERVTLTKHRVLMGAGEVQHSQTRQKDL